MRPTRTGLVFDEHFEAHDTGREHPERPARTRVLREALAAAAENGTFERIQPRRATDDEILAVHDRDYLDRLADHCRRGARYIDCVDSAIGPASEEIARLAAGAVLEAVDAVMAGRVTNAFCAVRPPGHHAERHLSMGFCLLNNVAMAAQYLRDRHGLGRIAVVDWDVHHGNGTQHMFENRGDVLVVNLHGHPAYVYPGSGFAHERGYGAGEGATLNVPLYPGALDSDYRRAFDEQVLPVLEQFRPEFVLISAGFDAHRRDPLAPLELDTTSFGWMTDAVRRVAEQHAAGRLVSVLEGGYDLDALRESVLLHVGRLNAGA